MMAETKVEENQITNANSIKRSIAGGLIGAAVGYLATIENGKKIVNSIDGDKLKSKGADLSNSFKDKSIKAADTIKTSATQLFNKEDKNAKYEHLNERMDRIEEMLTQLTNENADKSKPKTKKRSTAKSTSGTRVASKDNTTA